MLTSQREGNGYCAIRFFPPLFAAAVGTAPGWDRAILWRPWALMPAPRTRRAGMPVLYTWEGFRPAASRGRFRRRSTARRRSSRPSSTRTQAFENLKAGLTVDLAHPCADTFGHWYEAGLLQPIDTGRLANWPDLFERLKTVPGSQLNGKQLFHSRRLGHDIGGLSPDLVESPGRVLQPAVGQPVRRGSCRSARTPPRP